MTEAAQTKISHSSAIQIEPRLTRLLLALWFLGGEKVSQGELTKKVKLKEEKSADCQEFFTKLKNDGAIKIDNRKISITNQGRNSLSQSLKTSNLSIEGTIVGSWLAKALLKWIQQSEESLNGAAVNGRIAHSTIASYEEFKPKVLSLFEKLNKGYNYGGLVPVWHLRRELGEQVDRGEFSDWMMEMQAEQEFYLQAGEAREATEDQKRDSITNEIRGLLFYASKQS